MTDLQVIRKVLEKDYPGQMPFWAYSENNQIDKNGLLQTPIVYPSGKGENFPEGHSQAFCDRIYRLILTAEKLVDITLLSPCTGMFKETIEKALTDLGEKGKHPVVRILISNPLPDIPPLNIQDFLEKELKVFLKKMDIYGLVMRSGLASWNHAKIIAVDGREVISGGHNLWDNHYLGINPVFDLSLSISGEAVAHAHDYVDSLWKYRMNYHSYLKSAHCVSYQYNASSRLMCKRLLAFPDPNLYEGIRKSFQVFQNTRPLPILALGRKGGMGKHALSLNNQYVCADEPADVAIVEALGNAQFSLHMSLQCLRFLMGFIPGVISAIVESIINGAEVFIIISNQSGIAGGLTALSAPYEGDDPSAIFSRFLRLLKKKYKKEELAAKNLLFQKVHIANIRYNEDDVYPYKKARICNHAKSFLVDGSICYIGSQNLYPTTPGNLNEFGYLVEDIQLGRTYLEDYFYRLWQPSSRTALPAFKADVEQAEMAETIVFLHDLLKNRQLELAFEKLRQELLTEHDPKKRKISFDKIDSFLMNAGYCATARCIMEYYQSTYYQKYDAGWTATQESDRFVIDMMKNKTLAEAFGTVVLKGVESDIEVLLSEFFKESGYECSGGEVFTSFYELKKYYLEYWTGVYYTWRLPLEMNSKTEGDQELVEAGPEFVIVNNSSVMLDGILLKDFIFRQNVLCWTCESNASSGSITFSEKVRPCLNDPYTGPEFFGSIEMKGSDGRLKCWEYNGRSKLQNQQLQDIKDRNRFVNWVALILICATTIFIFKLLGCFNARCCRDYHRIEELSGEGDIGADVASDYSTEIEMNLENQEFLEKKEKKERKEVVAQKSPRQVGSVASDMDLLDRFDDYPEKREVYHDFWKGMMPNLPWDYYYKSLDAKVEIEMACLNPHFDTVEDLFIKHSAWSSLLRVERCMLLDFLYENLADDLEKLNEKEIKRLLLDYAIPEITIGLHNEIMPEKTYLYESARSVFYKQKSTFEKTIFQISMKTKQKLELQLSENSRLQLIVRNKLDNLQERAVHDHDPRIDIKTERSKLEKELAVAIDLEKELKKERHKADNDIKCREKSYKDLIQQYDQCEKRKERMHEVPWYR